MGSKTGPSRIFSGTIKVLARVTPSGAGPPRKVRTLTVAQIPMPVMTLNVAANRFVVVECVQNLVFSPHGAPFLPAYVAVHGESDKHFSHSALLVVRRAPGLLPSEF